MANTKEKITIENARLIYKNFSGKGTDYNAEGDRNFCIVLNEELAADLSERGFNVKTKLPKEGYEEQGPLNYLKVKVTLHFGDNRDADIYRIVGNKRVKLDEKTVGTLDWDDIVNVDLRIRPWNWTKGNRTGVSAFLDAMYVTVKEDALAAKYSDEPDVIIGAEDVFG